MALRIADALFKGKKKIAQKALTFLADTLIKALQGGKKIMMTYTAESLVEYFKSMIGKGRRFATQVDMARFLGLDERHCTVLYRFLKGGKIQYNSLIDWLNKFNAQLVFPDDRLIEYAFVPRAVAVAGAGESFVIDDGIAGYYAFRNEFLEKIHVRAKDAMMMYVSGDSMTPLICDGDTVLFNTKDTEPKDGFIYVCSFGDALMVKRLQKMPGGWQLCSENMRYSPLPIQGDDLNNFRVHGRVRWFGRVI